MTDDDAARWARSSVVLLCLCVPHISMLPVGEAASPPLVLHPSPPSRNLLRLPDGTLKLFFVEDRACAAISSSDTGRTWSEPKIEFGYPNPGATEPNVSLVDRGGELHIFFLNGGGNYDVWHCQSINGQQSWDIPQQIAPGYVGALNSGAQLRSGRILLPQQFWVPNRDCAAPAGCHFVTADYSDDGGQTWKQAPAKLTAPSDAGFIGETYGACEPVILERKDGRIWMLMRTQSGFLYESFSADGVEWTEARPTRFRSTDSPAYLLRLLDGRIVLFWNNCLEPTPINGSAIYTTRDALHAAISADEGHTWRGYREIIRDPRRNQSPPKEGDRGTAYPYAVATTENKIVLGTGQGAGRLALLEIDPQWLTATHHEDDFSSGLDGWCVFKPFGPVAANVWRDRTQGPELVTHPTKAGAKVLHVRRPDAKDGDEAVWNFPMGSSGKLTLTILLQPSFGGATIALADAFAQPTDITAVKKIVTFELPIGADGKLPDGTRLETGRWHTLELTWDLAKGECRVDVAGKRASVLQSLRPDVLGLCYLRLRSTAAAKDPAGFLMERVEIDVTP